MIDDDQFFATWSRISPVKKNPSGSLHAVKRVEWTVPANRPLDVDEMVKRVVTVCGVKTDPEALVVPNIQFDASHPKACNRCSLVLQMRAKRAAGV